MLRLWRAVAMDDSSLAEPRRRGFRPANVTFPPGEPFRFAYNIIMGQICNAHWLPGYTIPNKRNKTLVVPSYQAKNTPYTTFLGGCGLIVAPDSDQPSIGQFRGPRRASDGLDQARKKQDSN